MKQKKSIEEIIKKENPQFKEEADALSAAELDARLGQIAKDTDAVEQAKENDEELEQAKEQVSVLGSSYRDAKKALRLKTRYIIHLLKEKGAL